MKICYEIEDDLSINGKRWFLLKYTVLDASHSNGPPTGEIKTTFSKGDLIDIAFPVKSMDKPMYEDVNAMVGVNTPPHGWMISLYFDSAGVDFGPAYRVIYTAKIADISMVEFRIVFVYRGKGNPGSQPWGFTAANDPGQHTEIGETYLCGQVASPSNLNLK